MATSPVNWMAGQLVRTRPPGLKARVHMLLAADPSKTWTLSDISRELGLSKIDNPDISSALAKLRNEGLIKAFVGPASAQRGRRYVKRYSLVVKPETKPVVVLEMDLRRQLSFAR